MRKTKRNCFSRPEGTVDGLPASVIFEECSALNLDEGARIALSFDTLACVLNVHSLAGALASHNREEAIET